MSRTPNRDRALRILAESGALRPKIGRRIANSLHLDLRGPLRFTGDRRAGIDAPAVVAALKEHRTASRIYITINSEGGSLDAARSIYAALRQHPGFKVTNAEEICASAATIMFLAGDFRTCEPNTRFLLHAPEALIDKEERWTAAKHARAAKQLKSATDMLINLYAERTGRDARCFSQEILHEDVFGVSRAKRLGLIQCLTGEERWINGRPYYFPDGSSGVTASQIQAFTPRELRSIALRSPQTWRGTPIEYLAFAAPGRG